MNKTILFLLFVTNLLNAQVLKGIIVDSQTKTPLSYANIVLMDGKGTYSNNIGEFEIEIKNSINDTLKVSYVGYQPQYIYP